MAGGREGGQGKQGRAHGIGVGCGHLVQNDAPLGFQVGRAHGRIPNHVGQHFEGRAERAGRHGRGELRPIQAGVGRKFAAHALNGVVHVAGLPGRRSLKKKVFQEMGDAVVFGRFVGDARPYPQIKGDDLR